MARYLADLPYTDIEAALASSKPVVAILPVGAIEAHGPHLPLATDVIISEGFSRRAADLLDADGRVITLVLPSLAYTPAEYATGFAGTLSVSADVCAAVIEGIAVSIKRQGFACLALANSHFDPSNVAMLRDALERAARIGLRVAFPDATRRKIAERLTDEFRTGDCHAGSFESSIVLAERPDLVNEPAMLRLPDNSVNLIGSLKSGGHGRFEYVGMPHAYCGCPKQASAQEGVSSLETLAAVLRDSVFETLGLTLSPGASRP